MTHTKNSDDLPLFSFMGPGRWSPMVLSAFLLLFINAIYMVFVFTLQMFEGWTYTGAAASFVLLIMVLIVAWPICYLSAKLISPLGKYAFPAGFSYAELHLYRDRVEIKRDMAGEHIETIPLSEIEGICIAAGENAAERFLTGIEPDQQRSLERLRTSASGWVCLKRKGSRDGIFISGWSGKNIISNLHEYIKWHRQGSMGRKIALAQRISSQTGLTVIGLYKAC